jgi:hypothetical protein
MWEIAIPGGVFDRAFASVPGSTLAPYFTRRAATPTVTREVAFTTSEQHARDYLARLNRRKVESPPKEASE